MGNDAAPGNRRLLGWLVAAAVVVLIGAAAAYAVLRGSDPAPRPTGEAEPSVVSVSLPDSAGSQRCMVPTAEALRTAELAFDGDVVQVAGRAATLVPTRVYSGGPTDEVRVGQATRSRQALILGVRFEEGARYLVAANGGEVMVCGFSGPYGPRLARLYERAFGAPE